MVNISHRRPSYIDNLLSLVPTNKRQTRNLSFIFRNEIEDSFAQRARRPKIFVSRTEKILGVQKSMQLFAGAE